MQKVLEMHSGALRGKDLKQMSASHEQKGKENNDQTNRDIGRRQSPRKKRMEYRKKEGESDEERVQWS